MYITHRLHDSWENGNRKDVVEEILTLHPAQIAIVSAELCGFLKKHDEKQAFLLLFLNRLPLEEKK